MNIDEIDNIDDIEIDEELDTDARIIDYFFYNYQCAIFNHSYNFF